MVILEIIVTISAYIMTNHVAGMVDTRMNYAFSQFQNDPNVRVSIHSMQRTVIGVDGLGLTGTMIDVFQFLVDMLWNPQLHRLV